MTRLSRSAFLVCLVWVAAHSGPPLNAQQPKPAAADAPPPAAVPARPAPPSELDPQPGQLIRLKGPDGRVEWEPYGAVLDEFLAYLRRREAGPEATPFSLSSVVLVGTDEGDRARFQVEVDMYVDRDDEWLHVPLALPEGYLLPGMQHTGSGQFRPAIAANRALGQVVYLRGKGPHHLSFAMVVPIKTQLNQHRLQLTIPAASASKLTLLVPKPHCEVKPFERAFVQTVKAANDSTRIEAIGVKGPIDLSWQCPGDEPKRAGRFDVVTRCALTIDSESMSLSALQAFDVKQGVIPPVKVRLPAGFRLTSGQQLAVADPRVYTATDLDANGQVRVELTPVPGERAEFRWELAAAAPLTDEFSLRGFEVEGARAETGELAVVAGQGVQFSQTGGNNVRRIDVNANGAVLPESAYAFIQPFRLDFRTEQIKPRFSVDPKLFLTLVEQHADLVGQFQVEVREGAPRELTVKWPQWRAQGWKVESLSDVAEIVERTAEDSDSALKLRLSPKAGARFMIALHGVRPVLARGASFPLTLPLIDSSVPRPATIVVAEAENVKATLEPQSGTSLRAVTDRVEELKSPEAMKGLSQTIWRADSRELAFNASVSRQQQQVVAESKAWVERQGQRLQITQQISYDVAYERLAEARLIVPALVKRGEELQFYVDRLESNNAIRPNWSAIEANAGEQVRIALAPPRIGKVELFIRYYLPIPDSADAQQQTSRIELPFVRSRDASVRETRVEFSAHDGSAMEIQDDAWTPQVVANPGSSSAWATTGDAAAVTLQLQQGPRVAGRRLTISKSLLRSSVDAEGNVATTAYYRLESPPPSLQVNVPAAARDITFRIDGQPLEAGQIRELRAEPAEFRLDISTLSASPSKLLAVEYVLRNAAPLRLLSSFDLRAPTFAEDVRVGPTIWEVSLPFEHFLLQSPRSFSPEFQWRRQTAIWTRQPTSVAANLSAWIGDAGGWKPAFDGNRYAFSRFGGADALRASSIAQPMTLFLGAGLSLIAVFVLLKLDISRALLTLFSAAFVVALVSLRFSDAVAVLIQPAVFGLLVAMVAAFIDRRIQRRRPDVMLTLPTSEDFVVSSSPSTVNHESAIDAEAQTVNRSPHEPAETVSSYQGND